MDFSITREQKEFVEEVKRFGSTILNNKEDLDKFSYDLWMKIADFGLLSLVTEEKYGGLGESYLTAAMCIEALGYASRNNGLVFAINNHIWVAQNLINIYGSDILKEKYLEDMGSGKKIGCFALTEPDSGSDALSMASKVHEENDYYILTGTKMFISNGPIADVFMVVARNQEDPRKFSILVVEKDFIGVKTGNDIKKMGLNSCPTSEVVFDNVSIPKENILGTYGSGEPIMNAILEWERCYEFAPHVGAMQRIMEECCKYASSREQAGKKIIEYQAISHKIADMKVAVEMSKLMLYKIASLKDQRKNAFLEASIFKLYVSENYVKICQDAIQIFGGYGYCEEYMIERELRDAIGSTIYSGTSEIQRNIICNMVNALIV